MNALSPLPFSRMADHGDAADTLLRRTAGFNQVFDGVGAAAEPPPPHLMLVMVAAPDASVGAPPLLPAAHAVSATGAAPLLPAVIAGAALPPPDLRAGAAAALAALVDPKHPGFLWAAGTAGALVLSLLAALVLWRRAGRSVRDPRPPSGGAHAPLRRRAALLGVDLQNDFCAGGALAVPAGDEVVPVMNGLRALRAWAGGIFLTQDWHPRDHASFAANNPGSELFSTVELPGIGPQVMWPVHCVQGTRGADFHPGVERDASDVVIQKGTHARTDSYSGFGDASPKKLYEKTPLEAQLRSNGVTDVFVTGLATDYCVGATCKDSAACGFRTYCVIDGSRHIAEASLAAELAAMRAAGVKIVRSADVPALLAASTLSELAALELAIAAREVAVGAGAVAHAKNSASKPASIDMFAAVTASAAEPVPAPAPSAAAEARTASGPSRLSSAGAGGTASVVPHPRVRSLPRPRDQAVPGAVGSVAALLLGAMVLACIACSAAASGAPSAPSTSSLAAFEPLTPGSGQSSTLSTTSQTPILSTQPQTAAATATSPNAAFTRRAALLLVDLQNDFVAGGALAVPAGDEVIPVANALRALDAWPGGVFLTQDFHPPNHASFASNNAGAALFTTIELPGVGQQIMWPDHCVQGTRGADFHAALVRSPSTDIVIQKGTVAGIDSYSGFGDSTPTKVYEKTPLEAQLFSRNVTDVFVMGLATDFCVSATCKDSAALGFRTFSIIDGSRHIAEASLAAELEAMRAAGVAIVRAADVPALLAAPTRAALDALVDAIDVRERASEAAAAAPHA